MFASGVVAAFAKRREWSLMLTVKRFHVCVGLFFSNKFAARVFWGGPEGRICKSGILVGFGENAQAFLAASCMPFFY